MTLVLYCLVCQQLVVCCDLGIVLSGMSTLAVTCGLDVVLSGMPRVSCCYCLALALFVMSVDL